MDPLVTDEEKSETVHHDVSKPEEPKRGPGRPPGRPKLVDDAANEPDPNYPELTRAEVAEQKKIALQRAIERRQDAALAKVLADEEARLKKEEGLADEPMVQVTLRLPLDMTEIRLDGTRYVNGHTYTVTEKVARDLLYAQDKGWRNESARVGEDAFSYYARAAQEKRQSVQPINVNLSTGLISGAHRLGRQ